MFHYINAIQEKINELEANVHLLRSKVEETKDAATNKNISNIEEKTQEVLKRWKSCLTQVIN
jgi:hypothetical protein